MPHTHLTAEEKAQLLSLRAEKPARSKRPLHTDTGQRVADFVAATVGSWRFIIIQSALLAIWIALNVTGYVLRWDPYPFILLNLALSFQAAYTAPIIMMSQNRQSEIDRRHAEFDYRVNVKAELEIEALHAKLDSLREQEIIKMIHVIEQLSAHLAEHRMAETGKEAPG
ncbi:DUF1003 domain-containing protein [Roseococcus sp. SYP-B2431]|uniref:DUF1003 domain-containing protein n=1 Tax=Roseococcus sp. SYP-B2431 TaxID=2496640 RepID=UPI00103CB8EB|nr:DUF1003 domain-containing protein [Roseococcus sp. SYP-B2431]TCH98996.1 DUF1003 domain-containing protein [Roseococcus sp. SYP-B2431]